VVKKAHVVVSEDDPSMSVLQSYLIEQAGDVRVTLVETGRDLHRVLAKDPADLLILDLNLPDEDGLVLAREIRMSSDLPIIVVTGNQDEEAMLTALEIGADDFIRKPFNLKELQLRIRNRLDMNRRDETLRPTNNAALEVAEFRIDEATRSIIDADGNQTDLTLNEFQILCALARRPGMTLARAALLDAISTAEEGPGERAIDIYVRNLRQKLGDDARDPKIILSVRGVGYRLAATRR
jgi:DNA-binding response OmpR family regulator